MVVNVLLDILGLALEYLIHLRNRPFSQLAMELRTLLNDHTASDHTKQFRDLTVTIYRTKRSKSFEFQLYAVLNGPYLQYFRMRIAEYFV